MSSPWKNLALVLLFAFLVKEAFYVDAAPTVTTNEMDEMNRVTSAVQPTSMQIDRPSRAFDNPTTAQNDDSARRLLLADEPLAKGPLSGIVPGSGGGEQSTAVPASTSTAAPSGSSLPGSGYLSGSGLPGISGLSQGEDGGGQNPTLILGGFSVLVMPMRGMNMANIASMLSAGQQLGQIFPKPGGS
ncbi:uncharacterized protein LOC112681840 isoform X4 [Sipha flava]|uniref:Uncharacterized protein LOC112681840 isoform X4 n=1 Tax=Sipha flava TaxID=143950 RepID=A0A8B8FBF7_9HEMI|nr:uncharacterized protein LOC112681840 isoform X4 [Sipha flava]